MSFQRIAVDGDDVGVGAGGYHSDFAFHFQHFGGARGCGLNCVHWRHPEIHHAREFARDRFGPGHSADVGAEDDFQVGLQRLLERDFVRGGACAIAFACRRVFGLPSLS